MLPQKPKHTATGSGSDTPAISSGGDCKHSWVALAMKAMIEGDQTSAKVVGLIGPDTSAPVRDYKSIHSA